MPVPDSLLVLPPRGGRFHRWRRRVQGAALVLLVAAPFLDLLRVDLETDVLVLLGTRLSLGELGVVYGVLLLAMLVLYAAALLYGRLWCGWVCPQTSLSELAAGLERKLLKRRSSRARRALRLALLLAGSAVVAASMTSYFLPLARLLQPPPAAVAAFAILWGLTAANLLWVRHRFCPGVCPYGILQSLLQDEHTLGVALDPQGAELCVECDRCARACFVGVDAVHSPFDSLCFRCGDCVDAACEVEAKRGVPRLLRFGFGRAASNWPRWMRRAGVSDARRLAAVVAVLLLSAGLVLHVALRSPLPAQVSPRFERTEQRPDGSVLNRYSLALGNRQPRPIEVRVSAEGLAALELLEPREPVQLLPAQQQRVELALACPAGRLPAGAHPFILRLDAPPDVQVRLDTRFFVPSRR